MAARGMPRQLTCWRWNRISELPGSVDPESHSDLCFLKGFFVGVAESRTAGKFRDGSYVHTVFVAPEDRDRVLVYQL